ncbi:MAG: hypothetical protein ACREP9_14270, partial [Candidatus Dormibacteraceae bacterium]
VRAQLVTSNLVSVYFSSSDELDTPLALMVATPLVKRLLVAAIDACSSAEPGGPSVRGISAGEPDEGSGGLR